MQFVANGPDIPEALLEDMKKAEWFSFVELLHESGMCERFPKPSLELLDSIIGEQQWPPRMLGECLSSIAKADLTLGNDPRYSRMTDYARTKGVL